MVTKTKINQEFKTIHELAENKLDQILENIINKVAPDSADLPYKVKVSDAISNKSKNVTTSLRKELNTLAKQEFSLAEFVADFSKRLEITSGAAQKFKYAVDKGDSSGKFVEELNNNLVLAVQSLREAYPEAEITKAKTTKAGNDTYMSVIQEAIKEAFGRSTDASSKVSMKLR